MRWRRCRGRRLPGGGLALNHGFPIDVWSLQTFDEPLIKELRSKAALVEAYFATDRALYLEREASDHTGPLPSNKHAGSFQQFVEVLAKELE